MRSYLLDTNHVSRFMRRDRGAGLRDLMLLRGGEFYLCTPSLGELYFMVYNSEEVAGNIERLSEVVADFPLLPFDAVAAEGYGQLRAELQRAGHAKPPIDLQIAAIAVARDLTLLTADHHFDGVPRLRCESWLS